MLKKVNLTRRIVCGNVAEPSVTQRFGIWGGRGTSVIFLPINPGQSFGRFGGLHRLFKTPSLWISIFIIMSGVILTIKERNKKKTLTFPSPFFFCSPRGRFDWNQIGLTDVVLLPVNYNFNMLILHSIQVKNYWILECQYLYNFARARQVWDFGIIFY